MKNKHELLGFLVAAILSYVLGTYIAWDSCTQQGGTLVQGILWWECI